MKIMEKVNFGLKEIINAESATSVIRDFANQNVKVTGLLIGLKENVDTESGEIQSMKVGVLKTENCLISSISPTVIGSIETIISAYKDADLLGEIENGIDIKIISSKSSKGRDFFHLELV